ncbi:hypothetical protein [Yersinia pekkanenii]|uniref:Uncharacterized protein n=1 Tax=Yersinia pekkanenii TaxID=1288385 RepID=A0A0T9R7Y6_9GAMM|nr:hypothetical protein [Yersinia pekkanenii]CNI48580.1 Uncharacterised protein [Yersinia pekkanenii]CRY68220.1 Uncharacterised protein [Yersinia pekkanenii]
MNDKNNFRAISVLDDVISTLAVSGYSASEIEALTRIFNEDADSMSDVDFLTSNKRLEMTYSLSKEQIVHKLKRLAEGPDPIAAVEALKVLAEMSEKR